MGRYPCFGLCVREHTRPTFCSLGVQCTTLVSQGVEPRYLPTLSCPYLTTAEQETMVQNLSTRFRLRISGGYAHHAFPMERVYIDLVTGQNGTAGSRTLLSGKSLSRGGDVGRSQFLCSLVPCGPCSTPSTLRFKVQLEYELKGRALPAFRVPASNAE